MNLEDIRRSLETIGQSAESAFLNDDTELRREVFNEAERQLKDREADQIPMHDKMFGQHKFATTIRDIAGISDPIHREARARAGLGVGGDTWQQKTGTALGRLGADIASDNTRNIYWFLNALQAATNLGNEVVVSEANDQVRGTSPVKDERKPEQNLEVNDATVSQAYKQGVTDRDGNLQPGYRKKVLKNGKRIYTQTNLPPSIPTLLGMPASMAVNSSLGLLNPFGGQEGYQAVVPSEEDPTKTANIISEVGQKYIMGRTGNLLPYDEFKKVRPDVSEDEYRRYKAFKYEKGLDLNPLDDGDITAPFGILKYTTDGIHGPEIQYLGRSLPVTTGVIPLASTFAGTYAGLKSVEKMGDFNNRSQADVERFRRQATRRGIGGGLAGYTAGAIAGTLIENERRDRNMRENLPKSMPVVNTELSNL